MLNIELYDDKVQILMSHLEADGSTIFRLQGRVCRYWGSALPMREGERVVAAGHWHPSGVLLVRAICLPSKGLFFSRPAWSNISNGVCIVATGAILTTTFLGNHFFNGSPTTLTLLAARSLPGVIFGALGLVCAFDGGLTVRSREKVKARLKVTGFYQRREG